MKKNPIPTAGEIRVIKSGNIPVTNLSKLIQTVISEVYAEGMQKVPCSITQGENWLCIASVIGDICLSVNVTEVRRTDA